MIAMKMPLLCLVAAFATNAALSQMQHGPVDTSNAGNRAPILDGLGNHAFPVSTKNGTAQKLVNQGLVLNYAFNHAEAHRSFSHAADWDKELAMAYWGQALSVLDRTSMRRWRTPTCRRRGRPSKLR